MIFLVTSRDQVVYKYLNNIFKLFQDPPAFKVVRKKDSERVQKLIEDEDENLHFVKLRKLIEKKLDESSAKRRKRKYESEEKPDSNKAKSENYDLPDTVNINPNAGPGDEVAADDYVKSTDLPRVIKQCLEDSEPVEDEGEVVQGLGPTPEMLGLATSSEVT